MECHTKTRKSRTFTTPTQEKRPIASPDKHANITHLLFDQRLAQRDGHGRRRALRERSDRQRLGVTIRQQTRLLAVWCGGGVSAAVNGWREAEVGEERGKGGEACGEIGGGKRGEWGERQTKKRL